MSTIGNIKFSKAYESYESGLSLSQVGKMFCVSRQTIYMGFKRRGYTLREKNSRTWQEYNGKKFTLRNNGYYALTTDTRIYLHRYIWEKEMGLIPNGFDVHHIDEDKTNNHISNLKCLSKSDHTRNHGFKNNQYTKKNESA